MNPLNSIKSHLKHIESMWGAIKSEDTRLKARAMIDEASSRMLLPTNTVNVVPSEFLGSGEALGCAPTEPPPEPKETPPTPILESPFTVGGAPASSPIPPTDLPTVSLSEPLIDSWPPSSPITILGLAPNRRSLRASLPDNRIVSVERIPQIQIGATPQARLVRAGRYPLYRIYKFSQ